MFWHEGRLSNDRSNGLNIVQIFSLLMTLSTPFVMSKWSAFSILVIWQLVSTNWCKEQTFIKWLDMPLLVYISVNFYTPSSSEPVGRLIFSCITVQVKWGFIHYKFDQMHLILPLCFSLSILCIKFAADAWSEDVAFLKIIFSYCSQ